MLLIHSSGLSLTIKYSSFNHNSSS